VIVNNYRHGEAHFFDLHPPAARLLHYYVAAVGLGAPECAYAKDMAKYVECDMWQMRAVPCLLGTLLVPLAYAAARAHGGSPAAGLAASGFVAFDALFFSLSRVHLLDMVTLFSIAATVACHARVVRLAAAGPPPQRHPQQPADGATWWPVPSASARWDLGWAGKVAGWLALDGICLGCAVSSKFGAAVPTALWCVATLALACADNSGLRSQRRRRGATSGAGAPGGAAGGGAGGAAGAAGWFFLLCGGLGASALAVYASLLAWHFALVPWKGPEEGSYAVFALTKRRLAGLPLDGWLDSMAERLILALDYGGPEGKGGPGLWGKVAEFTMEQVRHDPTGEEVAAIASGSAVSFFFAVVIFLLNGVFLLLGCVASSDLLLRAAGRLRAGRTPLAQQPPLPRPPVGLAARGPGPPPRTLWAPGPRTGETRERRGA
jgi:hypothetical protein